MTTTTTGFTTGAVDEIASQLGEAVDRLGRYGDLDQARAILDADPDVLCRLWGKVDELWRHRAIDPELRASILRVAEQIDPALAEQLKHELDEFVPAVVLAAHEDELVPNTVALGAFPSPDNMSAPSIEAWFCEDPRRLRGLALEVSRFTGDNKVIATSVLEFASAVGIDLAVARDILIHVLLDIRHEAVAR